MEVNSQLISEKGVALSVMQVAWAQRRQERLSSQMVDWLDYTECPRHSDVELWKKWDTTVVVLVHIWYTLVIRCY